MNPEELSLPALAVYTELLRSGELIPEDKFSEDFPGVDYETVLNSLLNEGLYPEPAGTFHIDEPGGILFRRRIAQAIQVE
jgi:hypothetical protein